MSGDDTFLSKYNINSKNFYSPTGDDVLYGYAGNDTFRPGKGNDFIDGGIGNDTVHLLGTTDHYNISYNLSSDTFTFSTANGSADNKTLKNIENFVFNSDSSREDEIYTRTAENLKQNIIKSQESPNSNTSTSNYEVLNLLLIKHLT